MARVRRGATNSHDGGGDAGQSLVEFALLLPMLLLIILGVVDLGRGIYYYNSLSNLAREGARTGIVYQQSSDWAVAGNAPGTYSNITSYAGTNTIVGRVAVQAAILDLSQTTVTIQAPMGTSRFQALPLTVRVEYPFSLLFANWFVNAPTFTIAGQATMRIE